jgi:hypothetical protein
LVRNWDFSAIKDSSHAFWIADAGIGIDNFSGWRGHIDELGRNYNFVSGIGNIGEKAGKVLSTKWGKGLAVGGVGALGAGLYGYKKAKDYYLI